MIEYEKLKVYQASLGCVGLGMELTDDIPRGFSDLRNQLRRAMFSVSLNIVEGAGRSERAEKRHSYALKDDSQYEEEKRKRLSACGECCRVS